MTTESLTTELLAELVKDGGRSTLLEIHATRLAAEVIQLRGRLHEIARTLTAAGYHIEDAANPAAGVRALIRENEILGATISAGGAK